MACYSPKTAWLAADGRLMLSASPGVVREFQIPCGQCIGCRIKRKQQWTVRLVAERKLHQDASFLTMTYDDRHLPAHGALEYRHVQLMLKRLRKKHPELKLRHFTSCEYGGQTRRPHYHMILFGYDFQADRTQWRQTKKGEKVYRSAELESVWPYGNAEVGNVTPQSIAYVAGYCVKKITGVASPDQYTRLDPSTGELVQIPPEFARMSLRPGIGYGFLQKYAAELLVHDAGIVDAQKLPLPTYFEKYLEENYPEEMEANRYRRFVHSQTRLDDTTEERRAVREAVAKARANLNKGNLDK